MTTFAQHADLEGRLLWWGLEVSFDDFATISYRWGTMSAAVEGADFEERLAAVGNVQRGLGNDHLPVAANVTVVLDNTDFGADWLVARATVASQTLRARFRLKCGLADPATAVITSQTVGTFVCLDLPRRKNGRIQLALADDSLGKLNDFLVPPTFQDWFEDAGTDADNAPFGTLLSLKTLADWTLPTPLHFGPGPWVGSVPPCVFPIARTPADFGVGDGFASGHRNYIFPIVICATRDTATAVTADDIRELEGVYRPDVLTDVFGYAKAGPVRIPRTWWMTGDGGVTGVQQIWKAYKTHTITKDGEDWQLLWVALDVLQFHRYLLGVPIPVVNQAGVVSPNPSIPSAPDFPPAQYIPPGITPAAGVVDTYFAAFESFNVRGEFGSQVNGKSDTNNIGNAVDIAQDLVEYYSALGGVDTTRFARARLVTNIIVAGSIRPGLDKATPQYQSSTKASPYGVGQLRKALAELAATADLDFFLTKAAEGAVVAQGADFETQTTTYPSIDEERAGNIEDFIPSQGERWEPYNRVFVASRFGMVGPYDNVDAIAEWDCIRPRVLQSKWWWRMNAFGPDNLGSTDGDIWNLRNLESVVRPCISFVTDIFGLTLELGDYFTFSWTRSGQNTAHSAALWKVESMNVVPSVGAVEMVAVWMGDLQAAQPFLLDNETLFTRVAATLGRTATVTDGSLTVTFASGDLAADGVVEKDILRLRDTTEAAPGFTRNRDVKIASVDSATQLTLNTADTDFGTAGAHVVVEWSIVRGHPTYPTAVSDPANYPSGGAMYGKISDSVGQFSDGSAANKLLDG